MLIARGPHLEALKRNGVRVLSPKGDFHVHVEATEDLEAVAGADVVFVGLKAYSLPEIAPRLARTLSSGAAVMSAQNGIPWWYFQLRAGPLENTVIESVDPGGVISREIEPRRVIGCVPYPSTAIVAPGVIRHVEGTRFSIGEPDETVTERCEQISRAFEAGGLKCPVDPHLRTQIWLKLIGNAAFNPTSVLMRATIGELGETENMRAFLRAVMEDAARVAKALGVSLPVSIDRRLERGLAVGDHKTSMLQDYEAGKPLEIGSITGAVVEIADKLNVPIPSLRAVHACGEFIALRQNKLSGHPKPDRSEVRT